MPGSGEEEFTEEVTPELSLEGEMGVFQMNQRRKSSAARGGSEGQREPQRTGTACVSASVGVGKEARETQAGDVAYVRVSVQKEGTWPSPGRF